MVQGIRVQVPLQHVLGISDQKQAFSPRGQLLRRLANGGPCGVDGSTERVGILELVAQRLPLTLWQGLHET